MLKEKIQIIRKWGFYSSLRIFLGSLFVNYKIYSQLFSFKKLRKPLRDVKIKKPIFLIGLQNGGLTIVTRILRKHPDIVAMSGGNKNWAGPDEIHFYDSLGIPKAFTHREHRGEYNNLFGYDRTWLYATDHLFDEYYMNENNYNKKIADKFINIIKNCVRVYSENLKSARFIDKSQTYSLKIKLLKKMFPDAKFILILRNPYAICWKAAYKIYEKESKWPRRFSKAEKVRMAANHWKNTFKAALSDLNDIGGGLIFQIEDFLDKVGTEEGKTDPQEAINGIKKVLDYCELPYNKDLIKNLLPSEKDKFPLGSISKEKWYPLQKDVNSKYLKNLSEKDKGIITSEIGEDLIKKAGYEILK